LLKTGLQLHGDFGAAPQPCQESKFARAKHRYNAAFATAGPAAMDFSLTQEPQQIRDSIRKLCAPFDDAYWLEKDRSGDFPHELHAALRGPAGSASPCRRTLAAPVSASPRPPDDAGDRRIGAAMSGASAVHMNISACSR
jgi:hypothetical protein